MGEYDTSTGLMVGYYLLLVLKGVRFCGLCAYNSENLRVCMGFWPLCVRADVANCTMYAYFMQNV